MDPLYPTFKVCASCEIEKPFGQFKIHKDRPSSYCIDCTRERDRARRRPYVLPNPRYNPRNKSQLKSTKEGYRFCNACKQEKPYIDFHFRNGKPTATCITCEHARDRERNQLRRIRKTPVLPKATLEGHKVCNTCLIEKPHSAFMHDIAQKDGYAGRCKQCKSERYHASPEKKFEKRTYNNAYRSANSDRLRTYDRARHNTDEHRARRRARNAVKRQTRILKQRQMIPPPRKVRAKVCPQCSLEKFLSEFSLDRNRRDGHYAICKKCVGIYHHERLEERRIYNDSRRHDALHMASIRAKHRVWRHNNRLRTQGYQLQRLARKKGAVIVDKVDFTHILKRDGRHCYLCDKPILLHHTLTFDHIVPLVPRAGDPQGTHTEDNIKPTHRECNARKSNRRLEDLTPFDRRGINY